MSDEINPNLITIQLRPEVVDLLKMSKFITPGKENAGDPKVRSWIKKL